MPINQLTEETTPLVLKNIGYAKKLAHHFFSERNTLGVEHDDFQGAAFLGLCDAGRRFDISKGMNFQTYCYFRIRGAMSDLLRRNGCFPYSYVKDITSPKKVKPKQLFARSASELIAMADIIEDSGIRIHANRDREITGISYSREGDPEKIVTKRLVGKHLRRILGELSEKERELIRLRYFEGMSFEEIREAFGGVSKSWVSRVHGQALENLRAKMIAEHAQAKALELEYKN